MGPLSKQKIGIVTLQQLKFAWAALIHQMGVVEWQLSCPPAEPPMADSSFLQNSPKLMLKFSFFFFFSFFNL